MISGTMTLDTDFVTVVGADRQATNNLSFTLSGFTDWATLAAEWGKIQNDWGDPLEAIRKDAEGVDGQRLAQYLENTFAQFTQRTPTVVLYFRKASWELGNDDEFCIAVQAPQVVVDAIAEQVSSGKCDHLRMAITLAPSLSDDQHAPPSVPVTHGVLRTTKHDAGHAHGWVDDLSWGLDNTGTTPQVNGGAEQDLDLLYDRDFPPATTPTWERAVGTVAASLQQTQSSIESLAASTKLGFILVLLLIGALALFR